MNEEVVTFIVDNKGSRFSPFEKSLKTFPAIDAIQLTSSTQAMLQISFTTNHSQFSLCPSLL